MGDIDGRVEPGFEAVRDAFVHNFEAEGDVGAACAVYVDGKPVVDLWGGVADPDAGKPWTEDTIQLVYSTTKGATAVAAHLLVQRGLVDLDAPVSQYWPAFAAEGKGDIPVRWLLSHRTGLVTIDERLSIDEMLAWDPVVEALAAQKPFWEPGTKHGYHAVTFGYLVGELVRQVTGKSVGRFFNDEVAVPLGLQFWIGLPQEHDHRVARLQYPKPQLPSRMPTPEELQQAQAFLDPTSLTARAFNIINATDFAEDLFNSRRLREAEVPAGNGIGDARSLARMHAALIGEVDGIRLLDDATIKAATEPQSVGPDAILMVPTQFGVGFMVSGSYCPMSGPPAFGHAGMGGSLAFADAERGFSFGYVMNQMKLNLSDDPRTKGLIEAVKQSL